MGKYLHLCGVSFEGEIKLICGICEALNVRFKFFKGEWVFFGFEFTCDAALNKFHTLAV